MLIECPSCHTRATLPDGKEGAKVRCGECGRVYLALAPGAKRRRGSSGALPAIAIALGVAALLGVAYVAFGGGGEETVVAEAPPPPEEAPARPVTGWEAAPVQAAVAVHEAAYARDDARLRRLVDAARAWEWRATANADADAEDAEGEGEGETAPAATWASLSEGERAAYLTELVEELLGGGEDALVAGWRPYDGDVVRESDEGAVVRLAVTSREPGSVAKRWVEWSLSRSGSDWRAWRWERWLSPEEIAARPRDRGYEIVTLSDGSVVKEREPEPLAHLDDTPPELRDRIDALFATMMNLELTKEGVRARQELVAIGKPAIPRLLTGLYETPLETRDQAIQVNMIDVALREITGQDFGYKPMELVGSGVGTTRERRESAIRQWFAWWYQHQDDFEQKETSVALEASADTSAKK